MMTVTLVCFLVLLDFCTCVLLRSFLELKPNLNLSIDCLFEDQTPVELLTLALCFFEKWCAFFVPLQM